MRRYQRAYEKGGTYFFTVVTAGRWPCFEADGHVRLLGAAMRRTRTTHSFETIAMVVMPDHLHCVWRLPPRDDDFSLRWELIKKRFTIDLRKTSAVAPKQIWQPRFWEHRIRDAADFARHVDYVHYNPVKHGYVDSPGDWSASTFSRFVRAGVYQPDWGATVPRNVSGMHPE